jgi:hypothetical protein
MCCEEYRHLNAEGFARQARPAVLEGEIASLASHIHTATCRLVERLREFEEVGGKCSIAFAQVRAVTRVATPHNEATRLIWARNSTASHMELAARVIRA